MNNSKKTSRQSIHVRFMLISAVIAAAYSALSLVLAPISFGVIPIRLSEAFSLLPVFGGTAIVGLTLGCALTNAIGAAMGINIIGMMDVLFGTTATLIAALLSYALRKVRFVGLPIASAVPPVIVNAIIIGAELCFATTGTLNSPALFGFMLEIALSQFVPCLIAGPIIVRAIEKRGLEKHFK